MTTGSVVARRRNLQRLFAPASVAVVGASSTPGKVGHQAVLALDDFPGEVFPINPKSYTILGRPAFQSLNAVGRPVDLVLFALPASATVGAVREAIACGCGGGLVLSSGFSESGPEGEALQQQLGELSSTSTFRLLGPNTAGFVNRPAHLTASFVANATQIPSGGVAVVAQSAGVNFTVSFQLEQLACGVSVAVGLGNALDVGAADVLEFLAEHAETKAIALHLEGVPDGRRLYDVIRRVAAVKPVVALTVGRDEVGEFARSHTGNLIGSFDVRRAALLQAGATVVETTEELATAVAVLSTYRLPPNSRPGVGLLTAQAGPALLALDQLKSRGVSVPTLRPNTVARITELLPPMTHITNPVDTGRPGPDFPQVLQLLASDEQIDLVAAYALHEPAALLPAEVLPGAARTMRQPLLFGTQGPARAIEPTLQALREQGVFVARSPEQLARAATVLVDDAIAQQRLAQQRLAQLSPPSRPLGVEPTIAADEFTLKGRLSQAGIPTPEGVAANSRQQAQQAFQRLRKPVVAKILSEEIAHKTEVGGVQLNIENTAELDLALDRLDAIVLPTARRYLLEETAPPGLELIVGAVRDPSFGPTVTVGLGGILAEALRDTATRLAPLTLSEAESMLDELRAAQLFDGWRGGPKLDRKAVARTIVRLGDWLCGDPAISELEINPLRVYEHGVLALDAGLTRGSAPVP